MSPLWGVALLQAICTCLLLTGIALNNHRVTRMRTELAKHRLNLERSLTHLEQEIDRTRREASDERSTVGAATALAQETETLAEERHAVAEERYAFGEARNVRQHPDERKDKMAAKHHEVTFTVWEEKRWHDDQPDEIAPGDWRDADEYQALGGIRVQSNDLGWQESHDKSEPDWTLGFYGVDGRGRQIDLLQVFKKACTEGRVLNGVIIANDQQRHNS